MCKNFGKVFFCCIFEVLNEINNNLKTNKMKANIKNLATVLTVLTAITLIVVKFNLIA